MKKFFINWSWGVITNADVIRRMSDEELAEFLDDTQKEEFEFLCDADEEEKTTYRSCVNGWLAWLQQEAEKR